MKKLFLMIIVLLPGILLSAQEQKTESDTLRKDALNVFMDASDYIRKEITFVNYVRDIKDAHVYIISSYRTTGSGGSETTYFLVGQKEFASMKDTIVVNTSPDDTQDTRREKEVNALKMGLMRYVLKTPLATYIDVRFSMPVSETVSTDIWNSWVFRSSIGGFLQGQKSNTSSNIYTSISANRVTEKIKTELSLSYDGVMINSIWVTLLLRVSTRIKALIFLTSGQLMTTGHTAALYQWGHRPTVTAI